MASLVLVLAGSATAKTYTVDDGMWKFSFDLDMPIQIGLYDQAYGSNDTVGGLTVRSQVNLQNESTKTNLATIELYSFEKPKSMTTYPDMLEEMMGAKNFTNVSIKPYKIDGTEGIIASEYNSSLKSREYWSFSLIWPLSGSTSTRAVGITSLLGDNLSSQLFDTLHFEQANGLKEPLDLFSNSSNKIKQTTAKLGGAKASTSQLSSINGPQSPTQLSTKKI